MDTGKVLTDFAKVINSDRYQYTESDVFFKFYPQYIYIYEKN